MILVFVENSTVKQYPASVNDLRRKFPSVSFPSDISSFDLSKYGAYVVKTTSPPDFDYTKETLSEVLPVLKKGGWVQQWEVTSLSSRIIEGRKKSEEGQCRTRRNELLEKSDWTQLSDASVDKEAWASYRQKLRDITLQEGFPSSIEWPVAPGN